LRGVSRLPSRSGSDVLRGSPAQFTVSCNSGRNQMMEVLVACESGTAMIPQAVSASRSNAGWASGNASET
jgi:hypothetical protein